MPGVLPHLIPQTVARPSSFVIATSVRLPSVKVPVGPDSGRTKVIATPGTGRASSSVTSTVMPRVAPSRGHKRHPHLLRSGDSGGRYPGREASAPTGVRKPNTGSRPGSTWTRSIPLRKKWYLVGAVSGGNEDGGDIVGPAGGLCGVYEGVALAFEIGGRRKTCSDRIFIHYSVKTIATYKDLNAGGGFDGIGVDPQLATDPDRHREHVPHGVGFQRVFVDAQPPSDLMDPGLVLGNDVKTRSIMQVGTAVADTGDQDFL